MIHNAFRRDMSVLLNLIYPLTLHTESISAVLRLEDETLAVLSTILGSWIVALPPPPLCTLCSTG